MAKCSSLECHSKAVAKSTISGNVYCTECAIKLTKQHGPECMETLPNEGLFPWDRLIDGYCEHCGVAYTDYLVGTTGECPKCRRDLPHLKD